MAKKERRQGCYQSGAGSIIGFSGLTVLHIPARPWSAVALAMALLGGACARSGGAGQEPEVALADSVEAQARFRALREQWVSAPLDTRPSLERALTTFVQRYPTDPRGRWARIYLAWIAVQRGDAELARRWIDLAEPGARGAASDLARVVRAAIALLEGRAEHAYTELAALQGRLIDNDDRLLCLDQLVLAALASGHHREAVASMLDLAALSARRHRERMWRTLEPRLERVPLDVLEQSLAKLQVSSLESAGVRPADRAAAVEWMRQQILSRLSRSALAERDVELAQRLVATGRGPRDGAERSELLLLATQGTLTPTVKGRTLGLVLELGSDEARQRSLEVAAGISATLEGTGGPARQAVTLETRNVEGSSPDEVEAALARLLGEGASLLAAGLHPERARQAAAFAAARGLPVLLLHEPTPAADGALPASAYGVGADEAAAARVLSAALAERAGRVVPLEGASAPCRSGPAALGADRRDGAPRGALLIAELKCARALFMGLGVERERWVIGLGLGALGALGDDLGGQELWVVGAGRVPRFDGGEDPALARLIERKGRKPTWYEAIGHDVARIAQAALPPAPEQPLRSAAEVAAVHGSVLAALGKVSLTDLWTTDARGFDATRRLPHDLKALRVDGRGRSDGRD